MKLIGEIGEKAAEHSLEGTTNRVVDAIEDMRSNAAKHDIHEAETVAVLFLESVGVMAAGAHLESTASNAIETLGIFVTKSIGQDLICSFLEIENREGGRLDDAAAHHSITPFLALRIISNIRKRSCETAS